MSSEQILNIALVLLALVFVGLALREILIYRFFKANKQMFSGERMPKKMVINLLNLLCPFLVTLSLFVFVLLLRMNCF